MKIVDKFAFCAINLSILILSNFVSCKRRIIFFAINLSILILSNIVTISVCITALAINLSILILSTCQCSSHFCIVVSYKSIHIDTVNTYILYFNVIKHYSINLSILILSTKMKIITFLQIPL